MKKIIVNMLIAYIFIFVTACSGTNNADSEVSSVASELESSEVEDGEAWLTLEIGETFSFGEYEQDNNTENGKEPIEWVILSRDEESVLVISKYTLDAQKYNETGDACSWETCSLRTWMNEIFYNEAFTEEEKKLIAPTLLISESRLNGMIPETIYTTDMIFTLSEEEICGYMEDNSKLSSWTRNGEPTTYAEKQGVGFDYDNTEWWARSQEFSAIYADSYDYDLGILGKKSLVDKWGVGVRPTMCIKIIELEDDSYFLPNYYDVTL